MSTTPFLAFRLPIVGKQWTVYYCGKKYYKQQHRAAFESDPDGSTLAFTLPDDKQIFFQQRALKRETIIHELTHAYLWESCLMGLRVAEPTPDTMDALEEAFCDMMAKQGRTMLKQTDQIIDAYEALRARVDA